MKIDKNFDIAFGDRVIGVDEAGRGPLAGPVVAAAVVIENIEELSEVKDSKKLSPKKRELLYEKILLNSKVGISVIGPKTIDEINILQATLLAMKTAVEKVLLANSVVLVDGNTKIDNLDCEQHTIIKGDNKSLSIAAASIVAKVTRDRLMKDYSSLYKGYSFEQNKGYGTKKHVEAIINLGPTEIHRATFLKKILSK